MTDKALIVLDLNGVLVDRVHTTVGRFLNTEFDFRTPNGYYVFVRPHTKRFLRFLFKHFDVAIGSSMQTHNTAFVLERLLTKAQRSRCVEHISFTDMRSAVAANPNVLSINTSRRHAVVVSKRFSYTNRHRDYELQRIMRILKKYLKSGGGESAKHFIDSRNAKQPSVIERCSDFIRRFLFS